jgi:hypothetical protein
MMIATAFLLAAAAPQAEMALRCTVSEDAPLFARRTPTVDGVLSGGPPPAPVMKPLPQMMVVGWTADRLPVADALRQLAGEAGISVEADEGLAPVSWRGEQAPFGTVVTRLAQQAGGVASFDGKVIRVTRPAPVAPWRLHRPAGRDATLAALDALRGYGATDVRLEDASISFQASDAVAARIRRGLSAADTVIAFDVWTYRVKSQAPDWKAFDEIGPVSERHPETSGGGLVLPFGSADRIRGALARSGEVAPLGVQTVAGPKGWSLEVPLTQCAQAQAGTGAVVLKPVWTGQAMSLEVSWAGMPKVTVASVSPGSAAVIAGRPADGWTTVALLRPRVLSSR